MSIKMTTTRRVSFCNQISLYNSLTTLGPLYEVCRVGNAAAAKMLLEHGADIHDDDVSRTVSVKLIVSSRRATCIAQLKLTYS